MLANTFLLFTVNVEIFAQYLSSRISRRALDAQKFDVSENYYHNSTNRINLYVRESLTSQICLLGLDAQKFSCVKILRLQYKVSMYFYMLRKLK